MAFIIFKSCIHSIFRDSCKNRYLMLVVLSQFKIHTTHRVTKVGYLHYLPVLQANIFTRAPNFHAFSLLHTTDLFKVYDLSAHITHIMQSIQIKPILKQTPLLIKKQKVQNKTTIKLQNQKNVQKQ